MAPVWTALEKTAIESTRKPEPEKEGEGHDEENAYVYRAGGCGYGSGPAVEADHSCTGEDCAVCCQITLCRQLLEGLGLAGTAAVLTAALPRFMLRAALPTAECAVVFTLVALKVKLSD